MLYFCRCLHYNRKQKNSAKCSQRKGEGMIVFHKESKVFHLYNASFSYVFQIMRNGQLGQLYAGARIHDRKDFSHLFELCGRAMSICLRSGNAELKSACCKARNGHRPGVQTGKESGSCTNLLREGAQRKSLCTFPHFLFKTSFFPLYRRKRNPPKLSRSY